MFAYSSIALWGLLMVFAVSWQTVNLQRGGPLRVWIGGWVVALIWYQNVGIAADPPTYAWLAYALGSSTGAVLGWWVGHRR